jgi:nitroreductase
MSSEKFAKTIYPVNDLSKIRWSPRAFSEKPVEKEKIRSILEAARWSPSAGNLQPWRFIIGLREDETWQKIFESLDEGNKVWVKPVPVLVLTVGEKAYLRKNRVIQNGYYAYDTGQSVAHLTFEAMNQGLFVHQMAGFDPERAIREFDIPPDYQPLTVIAIGYIADSSSLPPDLKERELAERNRKDFNELVFSVTFGQKSNLFYEE